MNKADLRTPQRQNLLGLVILLANSIRKIGWNLLPVLIVAFLKENFFVENKTLIIVGIIAIILLLIVHSILFYLNFMFWIEGNDFILKKGYINKKIVKIPLEKIQTVNTKQNLLQQILNVVSLEIDTAGSATKEVQITALRKDEADLIKNLLVSYNSLDNSHKEVFEQTDSLVKLSFSDLFKISFSENIFKTGLLVLITIYSVYSQYREYIDKYFKQQIIDIEDQFTTVNYTPIIVLLIVFIIVSIAVTVIRTFITYYDLSLVKTEKGFELKCGLLNRKNNIVPKHKIQLLKYSTNPVKKLFDIVSVTMKQASPNDVKDKQSLKIPGCSNTACRQIINYIFDTYQNNHFTIHKTANYYFIRNWVLLSFPIAIGILFLPEISKTSLVLISIFGWFIPCTINIYLNSRQRNLSISEDILTIQKGAIGTTNTIIEIHKIQSVKLKQSVFQKRRGVASLKVVTASESLSIPFIDAVIATELFDYILYKTETTNKRWM